MYLRRLWLLAGLIAAGGLLMAGQMFRLTAVRGAELSAQAQDLLLDEVWTPTVRGRILDRKGRVLAEDLPSFEVRVHYWFLSGRWAMLAAERRARAGAGTAWGRMSPDARDKLIAAELPACGREVDGLLGELAAAVGVPLEQLEQQRAEIIERVQKRSTISTERRMDRKAGELAAKGKSTAGLEYAKFARDIAEERRTHAIAQGIDPERAFAARRVADRAASRASRSSCAAP